jgi:quercetin dioxygenase-like cupin family protein
MSNLRELETIPPRRVWDGVLARLVSGDRIDLAIVELEPDGVVPEHHHANEQLGLVIEGSVAFRVADEERLLSPGGTWRIPANIPHEVRAGSDGAVVVDIFTPPRADWASIEPEAPGPPRWPA